MVKKVAKKKTVKRVSSAMIKAHAKANEDNKVERELKLKAKAIEDAKVEEDLKLLDRFAIAALPEILREAAYEQGTGVGYETVALRAYEMANAMQVERMSESAKLYECYET